MHIPLLAGIRTATPFPLPPKLARLLVVELPSCDPLICFNELNRPVQLHGELIAMDKDPWASGKKSVYVL